MRSVGLALLALSIGCGPTGGSQDAGHDKDAGPNGDDGGPGCDGPKKTPPNLVPNWGFECGDTGWAPQTGTLEVVTDARTGAKAAKLTANASGAAALAPAGAMAPTVMIPIPSCARRRCRG